MKHPPLYGIDLCTDTTTSSIDSTRHRIVAVGISTMSGDEIYEGDEPEILQLVDHRIAILSPGVLVTWQGSILDLPLLAARARSNGIELGLRLRPDHRPAPPSVLRPFTHPWCADWFSHQHLELRRVYDTGARWWHPIRSKLDPESLIPPADALANRDPGRDARLARALAERRWIQGRKQIDRMPRSSTWSPPSESITTERRSVAT